MALIAAESRRADELEATARRRDLTEKELVEYRRLAMTSHQRSNRERLGRG